MHKTTKIFFSFLTIIITAIFCIALPLDMATPSAHVNHQMLTLESNFKAELLEHYKNSDSLKLKRLIDLYDNPSGDLESMVFIREGSAIDDMYQQKNINNKYPPNIENISKDSVDIEELGLCSFLSLKGHPSVNTYSLKDSTLKDPHARFKNCKYDH